MLKRLSADQKRTIGHWAMEFVIVVVGVLLALWLQERANGASRDRDARAAEAAIRDEMDDNLMILLAQDMIERCQNDRLAEIQSRLEKGGFAAPIEGNTFMESKDKGRRNSIYGSFALDVADTAWQSALANGSLGSIPGDRYRKLANIQAEFAVVERRLRQNSDAANALQTLSYGSQLTPELRHELLQAFNIASGTRAYFSEALPARVVAAEMRALGWNDKARIDKRIEEFRSGMKGYGFTLKPCAKDFANPFVD